MSRGTPHRTRERESRARGPLVRRLLGMLFAALTLVLAVPAAPAWAHAELVSTTPDEGAVLAVAQRSVELAFDEPVFLVPDGFQLYDGSGGHRPVPVEALDATVRVTLPPDLAEGSYVLGWRVVSDDSHPESGVLSFAVGRASAAVPTIVESDTRPVDVLYGALGAFGYLGLFCLVGFTVFDLFVARTTAAGRRLPWVAALVAVGAYVVLVPLTVVRERGLGLGALMDPALVLTGWFGAAALTLVLAASGVALMLLRPLLPRREGFWVGTVGAGAALVSVLPVGHTRTFGPSWLVMGADLVHAGTAAVWLGGLAALVIHLARARRRKGDAAEAAVVLGRFSTLAGGIVVLLGVTGAVLAVVMVGSVAALVGSSYGLLLLAKLGMVVIIGALAAWNRFGLVPRLKREGITGSAWPRLALAIRVEAVGVVLVVGLTSALTLQNPRATDNPAELVAAAAEASTSVGTPVLAELGTGHLTGRFSPGTAGTNVITFDLTDAGGAPIVPLGMPQVSVAEPNLSLGPLAAEVQPGETPGSYRAAVVLPVAGQWKITAAVRVNELEQPAAVADVVVVR
ncbi:MULTISPECIES: CopD family protein [unclassified Arthrobacter]|uniref:copper resistance CopC/CopD family protein n=1 Tax=unclassified Arthrobacter TaxID=235627 RepID=UPI001CFFCBF5|nr:MULTISPECIES: CopD family protein [unclassified Arthrobacter]MCB5282779.1 Copper transport protein YcnJ [Arthrobacter sp. ES1]WGZ79035.1 copper resistance protein CopC [Arthrobacter sp. EM1]